MPITQAQRQQAEVQQWVVARDGAQHIRLVAGPGTGKTHTIEKRVVHLLNSGEAPENIYLISFTRASAMDLRARLSRTLSNGPHAAAASLLHVSTMHSLALTILRRANLLSRYPNDPVVLDNWEQANIYDTELSSTVGCPPSRASEIRFAFEAQWQTLDPCQIAQAQVTPQERTSFQQFHGTRTNLYCCVLPGEVVYQCVESFQMGSIRPEQLPTIEHLIVDEYQDLNACDQEFIWWLSQNGAKLMVVGDDDQSIYLFRHANPDGIVQFQTRYPAMSSHVLSDCFRCTPAVVQPANTLIQWNPGRLSKAITSLYGAASPPVPGHLAVWSFLSAAAEAKAIAESCQTLIASGMAGREDEILILVADRSVLLDLLARELGNLGIGYDGPKEEDLADSDTMRSVYCLLRIARAMEGGTEDYPAHRGLLSLLSGVGANTARLVADLCIQHTQNFHALCHLGTQPSWLTGRPRTAVARLSQAAQAAAAWSMSDTVGARQADIANVLATHIFTSGQDRQARLDLWNNMLAALATDMTLGELAEVLGARTEAEQREIVDQVNARLAGTGSGGEGTPRPEPKRVRVLTMHGAKGLSGTVVFIPSAEQGIIPNRRALQATGLLLEARRLFYVSLTRAKAACIVSHAAQHTGAPAFKLQGGNVARLPRSEFLNNMSIPSVNRASGLTAAEAAAIMTDVANL